MKILVFIGGRANYSSIKSFIRECNSDSSTELVIVASHSATLEKYGTVADSIELDGFTVAYRLNNLLDGGTLESMARSTGLGILDMTNILSIEQPDYLTIVGDRFEMMSAVIAAAYLNVRIIHTMGGEITGTVDESIRHAITKFAHVHFAATERARNNILKMGEDERYVFDFGCPRIDLVKEELDWNDSTSIISSYFSDNQGVGDRIDLNHDFVLVSLHPVTTEFGSNGKYAEELLSALDSFGMQAIILWPNSDAGVDVISREYRKRLNHGGKAKMQFHKNLPINVYIHLMNSCFALLGNSSSAIREGAFIGVRALNIGSRQNTRENSDNIIHVEPSSDSIVEGLLRIKKDPVKKPSQLYGRGDTGKRMLKVLKNINPPIQKVLKY
jgi:UDP-hydrolysing UDP-N-acetyl-D-glucosamine 2-epimerase